MRAFRALLQQGMLTFCLQADRRRRALACAVCCASRWLGRGRRCLRCAASAANRSCCCCCMSAESPLCALLLPSAKGQARARLLANLFIRSAAFTCFSCLDVPRQWRSVRRAAALLIKAAAAAASGKLLPSSARDFCVLRRRKAPSLLLPDDCWLFDLSAACRWIATTVGCWRR